MIDRAPPAGDKRGLFVLSGISLLVLAGIVYGCFYKGVPDGSDALLGAIAAGILLFNRDVVQTIRAAWSEGTLGKMSDQLANSSPQTGPTGNPGDPVHVEEEKP